MTGWLSLTNNYNNTVLVNVDKINYILDAAIGSKIVFDGGFSVDVRQSYNEVVSRLANIIDARSG